MLRYLLFLFSPLVVVAQPDSVESFLKRNMESLKIPGLSFAVIKNDRVLKTGALGSINLELNVPATTASVYEIGSLTKQFTSMAIMLLAEEGKLTIEDKISSYFAGSPSAWNNITIRHLLNHTSGIQNHVALPGYLGRFKSNMFGEPQASQKEIAEWFFQLPQEFTPGETWSYDNTGYYLLGLIVEKAAQQNYWDFLEERIFIPLGMRSTRNTDTKDLVANRASGYLWNGSAYQNQPVLWSFVGFSAGSLMSTVEDLAKWDAALYTDKLVKKSTLDQMWQPARGPRGELLPFNCGFGWFVDHFNGHRILQHSGGTPGFSSVMYRFPDDSLTVVLLTNHADRMLDQLALEIAGMYVSSLIRPLAKANNKINVTTRHKSIFSELLTGRYDIKNFTTPMMRYLGTSTSKSLFEWYSSFGELKEFNLSHHEKQGGRDVYRYRVRLGDNEYFFTITVEKDGKIAQLYFS